MEPVKLFFSYSHKDEDLREELVKHLAILRRQGVIEDWHDRKIGAGREWAAEIDANLNDAWIILLLISSDFLASDYCYDKEMMRAMERHEAGEAVVIPVILRQCVWQGAPFGKLQGLPKDFRPVKDRADRDQAFTDIALGIHKAVEELQASRPAAVAANRPRVWNVAHRRNPNFTGREELLIAIKNALTSGRAAALTQAITGLGGVGKTQTAVEFAYRHQADYRVVWWIKSEETITLASDFAALAGELNLPEKDEQDQRVVIDAVRRWLEREGGWLLIFDNVNHPDDLREYLPANRNGHVIVTSRDPNWRGVAETVQVKPLPRNESIEFLTNRTGQTDQQAAGKLAEALGDLPLAMEQAGAYIEQTQKPLGDYLDLFLKRQSEMLKRGRPATDYPATVATTWQISFQEVERECGAAAGLLRLCAFFAPDEIPQNILVEGAEYLPEPLAAAAKDEVAFDEAIAALRRYSLIEVKDRAISVHWLVQAVARDGLNEEDRKRWAEAAVRIANDAFPYDKNDVQTWQPSEQLLPHALSATECAEGLDAESETTSRLLNEAGRFLHNRAQLKEAKGLLERAIKIAEEAFGSEHSNVAAVVNNLGGVLKDLGDLAGAKACFERAIKIDEAVFGSDHSKVAPAVNNLGLVLIDLGDLAGAKACHERAIKIAEAAFGADHTKVAICVNNLGLVLKGLGDLAGAKACFERAIKIDETAFGSDHPEVASRIWNLGYLMEALGELQTARGCYERALSIFERFLGENHSYTTRVRGFLERLLQKM